MQTNKDSCWLILDLNLVIPLWQHNFDRRLLDVLHTQKLAFDPNLVPVLNTTYVKAFEIRNCLEIAHPKCHVFAHSESACVRVFLLIVEKFKANWGFGPLIPILVVWIKPVIAFPLKGLERASKTYKLFCKSLPGQDDCERLTLRQTFLSLLMDRLEGLLLVL